MAKPSHLAKIVTFSTLLGVPSCVSEQSFVLLQWIGLVRAGTPLSLCSQKSPASKAGAGFKSVASAVIQSQARRGGDDTAAAAPAADSRAATQSRLYAGTASSEAKRREMLQLCVLRLLHCVKMCRSCSLWTLRMHSSSAVCRQHSKHQQLACLTPPSHAILLNASAACMQYSAGLPASACSTA